MANLDPSTFEAVNNANFKVVADQPALVTNLAAQNAVQNQQAMNLIAQASTGAIVKNLSEVDPMESVSVANVLRSELAPLVSNLAGAIASIQQYAKTAQTTPPPTA